MFEGKDYAVREPIGSAEELLAVIEKHPAVAAAVPREGWVLQLPLVYRKELKSEQYLCESSRLCWIGRCWWRSEQDGYLGYYAKVNLSERMLMEFRTLPKTEGSEEPRDPEGERVYLNTCVRALEGFRGEESQSLKEMWELLVSQDLRQAAGQLPRKPRFYEYHLPAEAITRWDWETLLEVSLKRYRTTREELEDYIAYRESGSELPWLPLQERAGAKAQGIPVWEGAS